MAVSIEVKPTFAASIARATGAEVRTGGRRLAVTFLGVMVSVDYDAADITHEPFTQHMRMLAKAVVAELRRRADALEQEQVHDAELVEEPRS